jgi:hypothetical protein
VAQHGSKTPPPPRPSPLQGEGEKAWGFAWFSSGSQAIVWERGENTGFNYRLGLTLVFVFLILVISITPSHPGGAPEFAIPQPGRVFQFPRDHGAHPEYKTEWWYYTGHLRAKDGASWGYQLTFFRAALKKPGPRARSAWALHTL